MFSYNAKQLTKWANLAHMENKMGGQRIDDHGSWVGARGKNVPYPDGAKMKQISEKEGSGSVMKYEDTEEAIGQLQEKAVSQTKKHPMRPGYRY